MDAVKPLVMMICCVRRGTVSNLRDWTEFYFITKERVITAGFIF